MDKLSELLDTEPFDMQSGVNVVVADPLVVQQMSEKTLIDDIEYTRSVQLDLIEKSRDALAVASKILAQSESPKAVESMAILLRTIADMNSQTLKIHEDKAKLTGKKQEGPSKQTNNIIMTGSLKDITKMLKEQDD